MQVTKKSTSNEERNARRDQDFNLVSEFAKKQEFETKENILIIFTVCKLNLMMCWLRKK